MTALVVRFTFDEVLILTDTLVVDGDTMEASHFSSKAYVLPHLGSAICGTGLQELVLRYYLCVLAKLVATDVHGLVGQSQGMLNDIWSDLDPSGDQTSTIYIFGYCNRESRFHGFVLRSETQFTPEECEAESIWFKPTDGVEPSNDLLAIVERQRAVDSGKVKRDRVGIGGEVQLTRLTPGSATISMIHMFSDYHEQYEAMLRSL